MGIDYENVSYNDEDTLCYSCYDQPYTEARYLYVIIDRNKSKTYNLLNTFAEEMNIKEKENNVKNQKLEQANFDLNQKLDNVKREMKKKEKEDKEKNEKLEQYNFFLNQELYSVINKMETNKKENDEKIKKLKEDKRVFESQMNNKMKL